MKATERNRLYRASKSDQAKAIILAKDRSQHEAVRKELTSEEKAAVQDKNTIRHQVVRDAKSEDQKKEDNKKLQDRMKELRSGLKINPSANENYKNFEQDPHEQAS